MDVILNQYDLKGAMLILGGIQLHPIVAAMLFRPKSFYEKKQGKPKTVLVQVSAMNGGQEIMLANNLENDVKSDVKFYEDKKPSGSYNTNSNDNTLCADRSASHENSYNSDHQNKEYSDKDVDVSADMISMTVLEVSSGSVNTPDSGQTLHHRVNQEGKLDDNGDNELKINNHKSSTSLHDDHMLLEIPQNDVTVVQACVSVEHMAVASSPAGFSLKQSLHRLCTSPRFLFFTCARCFSILAMYLVILFLPPYAIDNGCTLSQVTLMLSVVGLCDLPSRPFHGWIVSFRAIDATYYVGITTLIASIVIFICIFMPSYASIFVMGIGQGVFYNPSLCLMNVIIIDSVGHVLFARAMMLIMFTMYGSMTFLPIIFGKYILIKYKSMTCKWFILFEYVPWKLG